jgi:propionyl-CoA carboxylase alpha chain
MIERLLIANRGEIARRIMETCRRLGIDTVAVFSDADCDADFVSDADYSVALGGNTAAESYLRVETILAAVEATGADAVHPGYGFLAENAGFAQAVADAGVLFVGPGPAAIAKMGSKLEAKRIMGEAGVPLLPSAELAMSSDDELTVACGDIGYPLLIKASAGGGGRGMRIVAQPEELFGAMESARREAGSAFGDDTLYAERYLSPSRHVEVQIFGDDTGRVIHLHERECSIQRRHQKIIEEAPSPTISQQTREALHAAAVAAGTAIGYTNAGTVEFLVGPQTESEDPEFFFLEVNTRLQVEHPVTEAVLGMDLVELQLSVATGGLVPAQADVGPVSGHAIEARLYAEDPTNGYLPSTGTVSGFHVPGHVRVDSAFATNGTVSQFYDPMIAKVVAHDATREGAARRLARSLRGATVDGIRSNRALLVRILSHPEYLDGEGDSAFLLRNDPEVLGRPLIEGHQLDVSVAAAAMALQAANREAATLTPAVSSGFRNVPGSTQEITLTFGDAEFTAQYRLSDSQLNWLSVNNTELSDPILFRATGSIVDISVGGIRQQFAVSSVAGGLVVTGPAGSAEFTVLPKFTEPGGNVEPGSLVAAMPGTIVAVKVTEGDAVAAGDPLVVMEAMKMELAVTAPIDGVVTSVPVQVGDTVTAGQTLAVIADPS